MAGFDPRERRTELKLLERDRGEAVYENRGDVQCPVCDRTFDRVLATEKRGRQFTPGERIEFCVLRGDGELFVFTHR